MVARGNIQMIDPQQWLAGAPWDIRLVILTTKKPGTLAGFFLFSVPSDR